jgi:hypothetical protein
MQLSIPLVSTPEQDLTLLDSFGEPMPQLSTYEYLEAQVYDYTSSTVKEAGYKMQHFAAHEFRNWWEFMDVDVLTKLDMFREKWGKPIKISSANFSLGRHGGSNDASYHNVDKYGQVRAVDIFPEGLTQANAAYAVQLAEECGFGGIGVYTDTYPSMMMHVDNRSGRGRWARVNKQYVGIEHAYK